MTTTREKNYRGVDLVGGSAQVGDRVAYEDMANPRTTGTVIETPFEPGGDYRVVWDDPTDGATSSDCRQQGWTMVAPEHECQGCGCPRGDAKRFCDLCANADGSTQDRDAFYAAVRLFRALRLDPLADAHGANEGDLAVWTKQRAVELGWSTGPVVVWEGGPFEWAVAVTGDFHVDSDYRAESSEQIKAAVEWPRERGFYFEPITSFMLGVYRA